MEEFFKSKHQSVFTIYHAGQQPGPNGDYYEVVEYQADDGMTWEQWINSDYNIDGYYLSGAAVTHSSGCAEIAYSGYGDEQYKTNVIEVGHQYVLVVD